MQSAMPTPQKDSRSRIALVLLCGLAVACVIMSVTSDTESILEEDPADAQKVISVDIDKVATIYTAVPEGYKGLTKGGNSGRVRLINYFHEIERRIAEEVDARKADIESIKAKMAKNRQLNAKARAEMKSMLLAKMAQNAKIAKDNLDKAMAKTARTFADQAALANKRNAANIARSKKTRDIMLKNKQEAQQALKEATANQQHALAAMDASVNAHISQVNKDIAANSAQIKMNAKKARDAMDEANANFEKKMFAAKEEAENGRSKLAADAQSMDKKVRAMVSGQVSAIAKSNAAEFEKVRNKMAEDRAHADGMLKAQTTKLAAALNAQKVLQDKRYAQTVADIAEAKKEANDMIEKAKTSFKVKLMGLQSTVKDQVSHLNGQVDKLQDTVKKNSLAQADANRRVNAEMKRMVKLGADREAHLAKQDQALRDLMASNKASTAEAMLKMANQFNEQLGEIKKTMKGDREHNERQLAASTSALFETLRKNKEAQDKANEAQVEMTKRATLDAKDALRKAKEEFSAKYASLHTTVVLNDKKADKQIKELTGIVDDNAVKSAEGRRALKIMAESNKKELATSIRGAVAAGEKRAQELEAHVKDMDAKMRASVNQAIQTQIRDLTQHIHSGVEDLQLSTKEARDSMKREILYAVREAADEAKTNLAESVKWANGKFKDLDEQFEKGQTDSQAARDALQAQIDDEKKIAQQAIEDSVKNQNRALLALKTATQEEIKATNQNVDAYAAAIKKHASDVAGIMKANEEELNSKLDEAKSQAKKALNDANKASIERTENALDFIKDSIAKGQKDAADKFEKAYNDLADQRAAFDEKVAGEFATIGDVIASRSALYDSRFQETVKSIDFARKQATAAVATERARFANALVGIVATIKDQETKLTADIQAVSTGVLEAKAAQKEVNRKVDEELKRIEDLSNSGHAANKRARGKIRAVMDEHKAIAANEVAKLKENIIGKNRELRSHLAQNRRDAATALSEASKALYGSLDKVAEESRAAHANNVAALGQAKIDTTAALQRSKDNFESQLMTLTNTVAKDQVKQEAGLAEITGVIHDWKSADDEQRALLKDQVSAMEKDLNKAIVKAIAIGEAKARAVQERALANTDAATKALSGEIFQRVETMADDVFKAVLENRGKIADNYLAFKAYCGANEGAIYDYVMKGQGKALFSIGTLLQMIASASHSKTKPAEGISAGGGEVLPIFGGPPIKVETSYTKSNGLVNEWASAFSIVRKQWPYGLGNYLLTKVQHAMQNDGLLTVGSLPDKSGQYVSINGEALGLSSRLDILDDLGVPAKDYQAFLAKLTANLPKVMPVPTTDPYYIPEDTFGEDGWAGI